MKEKEREEKEREGRRENRRVTGFRQSELRLFFLFSRSDLFLI
jgi:hypothetical protein